MCSFDTIGTDETSSQGDPDRPPSRAPARNDLQYRMAQITLVLPFALPAPEFASDLARALQAPGLAGLLSRTAGQGFRPLADDARVLPHELVVAQALGVAHGGNAAVAAGAMRGYGLDPEDGIWFVVNPAHVQIGHSHLQMIDPRQLDLREDESRALFEDARVSFLEGGYDLRYGRIDTWFMRADAWGELKTSSVDAAVGMNLTDWMPSGPPARAFRKLQNDVQVGWYTHPANAAREARGQAPVNTFWPWGAASNAHEQAGRLVREAGGKAGPVPRVASCDAPGWLAGFGERLATPADAAALAAAQPQDGAPLLLVCGSAAAAAIAADWGVWLQQMARLEEELFAPLLAQVTGGRIKRLRIVLSHRDGHLDSITTPMAQRKFWRRPTLEALR
jgi:hypothetical protein